MNILNKNFTFLLLVISSIPFISCNDKSTEPEEQSGSEWVYFPVPFSDMDCEEFIQSRYFQHTAEEVCKRQGMIYREKHRCPEYAHGYGIEVLCGK